MRGAGSLENAFLKQRSTAFARMVEDELVERGPITASSRTFQKTTTDKVPLASSFAVAQLFWNLLPF